MTPWMTISGESGNIDCDYISSGRNSMASMFKLSRSIALGPMTKALRASIFCLRPEGLWDKIIGTNTTAAACRRVLFEFPSIIANRMTSGLARRSPLHSGEGLGVRVERTNEVV